MHWYPHKVLSCKHPILVFWCINYSHLHSFIPTENKIKFKRKNYKILVLTEYTTREKPLLPSSTPSIPLFSLSNLAILSSFYFSFSLLSCTSVSSPSNAGHKNCSSLESWLSLPASFSIATAILQTSFLNLHNLLNSSNFLETSVFHSISVCCFIFLALDLQMVSSLAFACALSTLKGLQAALALVQGAQDIAWL